MPDFGSPFGIGYGLGAAGAGAAQGLVQGQIMAPRLAYERLQSQALQNQIQSTQATKQALSAEAPTPSGQQDLTPYDKPVRDMEAQMHALRAAGQGDEVAKLMPDYIKFSQAQHMAQLGKGAQMLLGPNPKAALPLIKAAGMGDVTDVNVDPQTGQYVFTNADGSTSQMTKQDIANVAADPSHLAQYLAMQNLYGARVQNYQSLAQTREAETQRKAQHDIFTHEDTLKKMTQSEVNARIAAGGRIGAAQVSQQGANYRFDKNPANVAFSYFTSPADDPSAPGLGMDPSEALAALKQAQSVAKSKSPEQAAHEVTLKMAGQHPEWTPDQIINFQSGILRGATSGATAPAPTPASRKPLGTPAPVEPGVPKALKGAPQNVIDAYNSGKKVTAPDGTVYQKPPR